MQHRAKISTFFALLLVACASGGDPVGADAGSVGRVADTGDARGNGRSLDLDPRPGGEQAEPDAGIDDVADPLDPRQCDEDGDCSEGMLCHQGYCLTACLEDAECEIDALCDGGVCVELDCESDEDCDDGNPCTSERCTATGLCSRMRVLLATLPDDEPGDCFSPECVDGWPTLVEDEDDLPPDDGIECTVGVCRSGLPNHLPDHGFCNDGDPMNGEERCVVPDGCIDTVPAWACETELDDSFGSEEICGDGQDNDGDGRADEDCPCEFGSIRSCFLGPPAARDVGGCLDGIQRCVDRAAPRWTDCEGGILPSAEICDDKDNDCDGCVDDLPDCASLLECPVEDFSQPLRWYQLDGEAILGGAGSEWEWRVRAPINSATVAVEDPRAARTRVYFDVSGDYEVTLIVTDDKGNRQACTWVVHVRGDGLRVEMRWDTFGSVDIDLHLHAPRSTRPWCTEDDCYFANCRIYHNPSWGYPDSDADVCGDSSSCNNPRLDIDNIRGYDPENINLDNPNDGESFRVMAHMYSGSSRTNPVITIYCGGMARAVLGEAPDPVGMTRSGGGCQGETWRVADVTMRIDPDTGVTDCDVAVLGRGGGWDVRLNDASF